NRRHAHVCPALSSVITVSRPGCRRRTWVDSGPKASTALCFETQLTAASRDADERLKGHQHGCQGSQILGRRSGPHLGRYYQDFCCAGRCEKAQGQHYGLAATTVAKPRPPPAPDETRTYPVLPLRDTVVFPHVIAPLFVGRKKSILALEEVMRSDTFILLAAQKNVS